MAARNRELLEANGLLALQSAAIEKLNSELSRDLHAEKAARIEAREVDFGEFSQIYPDKDACLRYLADLKWATTATTAASAATRKAAKPASRTPAAAPVAATWSRPRLAPSCKSASSRL